MIYVDEKEPVGGEASANNLLMADDGHSILSLKFLDGYLLELVFSIVVGWLRLAW